MNHRLITGLAVVGALAVTRHLLHGHHHIHVHTERHRDRHHHGHGSPCGRGDDLAASRWTGLTEHEARERLAAELGDDTDAIDDAIERLRVEGRLAEPADAT